MYIHPRSKIYVRSAETSPLSTRASSIPSLHEEGLSLGGRLPRSSPDGIQELSPRRTGRQEGSDGSESEREEGKVSSQNEVPMETEEEEERVQFCVADVRKRLKDHSHTPKKLFRRDPEDPSGEYVECTHLPAN